MAAQVQRLIAVTLIVGLCPTSLSKEPDSLGVERNPHQDRREAERFVIAAAERRITGDLQAAVYLLDEAIKRNPDDLGIYLRRAAIWAELKQFKNAVSDYQRVADSDRQSFTACNNLAWILATCPDQTIRDGKLSIASATRACELTHWKDAHCLGTLAAAYAEVGEFQKAIEYQEQSLSFRDDRHARARLALYRRRQPYRAE